MQREHDKESLLRRGRIWVLVLLVTLLAPTWAARIRGLLGPGA